MSRYLRPRVFGATIFFTVNMQQRGSDVLVREIDRLRRAVRQTRAERPFRIDAWVVLPDHLHAVWTLPERDSDYAVRWGAIKARFTMSLRGAGFSPPSELPVVLSGRYAGLKPGLRHNKRERGVWQRRFWEHHIRNEAESAACVRYCHINPVKHGLVERPQEWLYSSVHRDIRHERYEPA
ncbi:REP-associated tyrosine transposase [Marimonas arenosa]|uniref:Transposase n=1 Tax=Marimonas arenosa TaxID=1795305 RepID=A0AAE3WES8_9RHOB|nr:transposase [Marimonas arenosa]MDQ2091035.1 transposase [Marimonas arenosa]